MTLDPYAVLGLPAGAPLADVKRAYRRLAKSVHPDSAGEAALPQFLAIHEAYEAILAGRPMQAMRGATSRRPGGPGWSAEAARAREARTGRWRPPRTPGASGGAGGPFGSATGSAAGSGEASSGGPRGRSGARPTAGRRDPAEGPSRRRSSRKATLGSTSYDDAVHEPFEPEWEGASWYGRASGTYWTVNPREYADPRKHGPEYQERARRAARSASGADEEAAMGPSGGIRGATAGPLTHEAPGRADASDWSTSSGWATADAREAAARATAETRDSAARQRAADETVRRSRFAGREADRARAAAATRARARPEPTGSAWVGVDTTAAAYTDAADSPDGSLEARIRRLFAARDWRSRVLLSLLGWPPLGVLAVSLIGTATGCATFSVACQPPDDVLPLVAGIVLFGLLLAIPAFARLSAAGTITIALTALPVAAFVLRSMAPADAGSSAGVALVILGLAWVAGMLAVLVVSRGRILRA